MVSLSIMAEENDLSIMWHKNKEWSFISYNFYYYAWTVAS